MSLIQNMTLVHKEDRMSDKTYRNIYKWGDSKKEEKINHHAADFLEKSFGIKEKSTPVLPGNTEIVLKKKSAISEKIALKLRSIVGEENYLDSDFERAKHGIGRFYLEILHARMGIVENPPDAVVYPRSENEIIQIVKLCNSEKIPIIPFAGNSSVTKALQAPKGGISLDLKNLNKIIEFNEINATVTAEAGVFGPVLEQFLNEKGFTCGHFPQSFEFSTVGGWVAAKGAGQASTGYGKMEDIALALTVVTPQGVIETKPYPAASIGPDIFKFFLGSEGTLGVITKVTLKVRKYKPKNSSMTSFIFPDFDTGCKAMREIMQAGFGKPHFFRLQDPEETDISFRMSGKEDTFSDKFLRLIRYYPMKRCLMYVIVDGDPDYTKFLVKKVRKIAKKNKAFETGKSVVNKWLEQRYSSAYLRDTLMDQGAMIDTLETAVTWDNLPTLWKNARDYVKQNPNTLSLVHISHAYENGANLYFIFMCPMDQENEVEKFKKFHTGLIDIIHKNNGSLSHHHGIGRLTSHLMKEEVGELGLKTLQSIKDCLDPNAIMNPGGTLGLK